MQFVLHTFMTFFLHKFQQSTDHWRAIGAITGAVLLLSFSDAVVKLSSYDIALGQLLLVRSLIALILLATGTVLMRPHILKCQTHYLRLIASQDPWVWALSMCLSLMWVCYYASLPFMPLSLAAACYYTAPIWMSIMSVLLLGRQMSWKEGLAITVGLGGVLTLLRPGFQSVSLATFLPLIAAFLYALSAIVTSSRLKRVSPVIQAVNLNLVLMMTGAIYMTLLALFGRNGENVFLFSIWPDLNGHSMGTLFGLGLLLAAITTAVAFAYQSASVPVIGLFDNCYLVFALLWGILLFHDSPNLVDFSGIGLIGLGAALASVKAP